MKGGQQTVTTGLDAGSQKYVDLMRRRAGGIADAGTPTGMNDAMSSWRSMMGMGAQGAAAMGGDAAAAAKFMNPYEASMGPIWDEIRRRSMTAVNDDATQAGAWGGSRHGVATGQALADVGNNEAMMRYGEFNNAMNRAGILAGMGQDASKALFAGAGEAGMFPLDVMNRGMGPTGQTQTSSMQRNVGSGILGGIATGAGLAKKLGIPPWLAAGLGGILGGF